MSDLFSDRFCASNHAFYYFSLEFALSCIRRSGYSALEFYGGTPHLYVDSESVAGLLEAKDLTARHQLGIPAFRIETESRRYRIGDGDRTVREKSLRYFDNALSAAACMGAGQVILDIRGGVIDSDFSRYRRRSVEDLRRVAASAEENGQELILSCVHREEVSCLHTLEEMKDLLSGIGMDNVGVCLSISVMAENAETVPDWFRTFGDSIRYVAFSGGTPAGDCITGDGCLPLDQYLKDLERNGYGGLIAQWPDTRRYWLSPDRATEANAVRTRELFDRTQTC